MIQSQQKHRYSQRSDTDNLLVLFDRYGIAKWVSKDRHIDFNDIAVQGTNTLPKTGYTRTEEVNMDIAGTPE